MHIRVSRCDASSYDHFPGGGVSCNVGLPPKGSACRILRRAGQVEVGFVFLSVGLPLFFDSSQHWTAKISAGLQRWSLRNRRTESSQSRWFCSIPVHVDEFSGGSLHHAPALPAVPADQRGGRAHPPVGLVPRLHWQIPLGGIQTGHHVQGSGWENRHIQHAHVLGALHVWGINKQHLGKRVIPKRPGDDCLRFLPYRPLFSGIVLKVRKNFRQVKTSLPLATVLGPVRPPQDQSWLTLVQKNSSTVTFSNTFQYGGKDTVEAAAQVSPNQEMDQNTRGDQTGDLLKERPLNLIQILTGHKNLNYREFKVGNTQDSKCRVCNKRPEEFMWKNAPHSWRFARS